MFVIALALSTPAHAQDAVGYLVADGPEVGFAFEEDGDVVATVYEVGLNHKVVEVDDTATTLSSIRDDDRFAYRATVDFDGDDLVATAYNQRGWEVEGLVVEGLSGPTIVTDADFLVDDHGRTSGAVVPLDQTLLGLVMYNTDDETLEIHVDRLSFDVAAELLAQARGLGL